MKIFEDKILEGDGLKVKLSKNEKANCDQARLKSKDVMPSLPPIAPRPATVPHRSRITDSKVKQQEFLIVAHTGPEGRLAQDGQKIVHSERSKASWRTKRASNIPSANCHRKQAIASTSLSHTPNGKPIFEFNSHACSYSQSSVSKRQNLTRWLTPASVQAKEQILQVCRIQIHHVLHWRLRPSDTSLIGYGTKALPVSQRPGHETLENESRKFIQALRLGLSNLADGNIPRSTAFFEQTFRILDGLIRRELYGDMVRIISGLIMVQSSGEKQLNAIFLKYIASIASVIHGPWYPSVVWAKILLALDDQELEETLHLILRASADFAEDILGPEDYLNYEYRVMRFVATIGVPQGKVNPIPVLDAIALHKKLMDISMNSPTPRLHAMLSSGYLSLNLLENGELEAAESQLSDVNDALDEYVKHVHGSKAIPTFPLMPIMLRVTQLGRLYSLQGRYQLAREIFQRAIPISTQHLGRDHPTTLEAVFHYHKCLAADRSYDEARGVLADLDDRLTAYMLTTP